MASLHLPGPYSSQQLEATKSVECVAPCTPPPPPPHLLSTQQAHKQKVHPHQAHPAKWGLTLAAWTGSGEPATYLARLILSNLLLVGVRLATTEVHQVLQLGVATEPAEHKAGERRGEKGRTHRKAKWMRECQTRSGAHPSIKCRMQHLQETQQTDAVNTPGTADNADTADTVGTVEGGGGQYE